jgi:outer membrane protein TolC
MKRLLFFLVFAAGCMTMHAQFTLDECQWHARENYPLIKQYGLIEQSTEYSVANAAKAYLPQVSFAAQATRQSDVTTFPQQMTDLYEQFGMEIKGLRKDQYRAALEVNQLLWDGGLTRAQKELSGAEGDVSARSVEVELYALRERVNQLYFGILMMEEQLRQNDLLRELLQSNYKRVEAMVGNGIALPGDLNAIKVEQLTVSQQRTQIKSMATAYRRMLSVMTGKKMDDLTVFEKPAIMPVGNLPSTTGSGSREFPETHGQTASGVSRLPVMSAEEEGMNAFPGEPVNRPELQLFAARAARFDAQTRAVKASVRPRLGFFAQGFYGNPGLDLFKDMFDGAWSWNYIAGIRLQWNFGSFYTQKGDLQKLSLARRQVENQRETFLFQNSLQQIRRHHAIEKMRMIMSDDDEMIALRTAIRRASEAQYANGTITVNDLLRDITAENQALLHKSLHELEWLQNIYELKYTRNN